MTARGLTLICARTPGRAAPPSPGCAACCARGVWSRPLGWRRAAQWPLCFLQLSANVGLVGKQGVKGSLPKEAACRRADEPGGGSGGFFPQLSPSSEQNPWLPLPLQVRFGQQKRYQDWFQRQYLSTPDSQSLRCDLIRYICGVVHPSNEVLSSDILPRWAIIGWLLTTCTVSPVGQGHPRLLLPVQQLGEHVLPALICKLFPCKLFPTSSQA